MPAQRRSSLLTERCSLQSLDLVSSMTSLVLDDEQACRSTMVASSKEQKQEQRQQLPPQQLRRSKRIQELNAKKQALLLSSPVSTLDTPSSTTVSLDNDPADQVVNMTSSSIVTPIKTPAKLAGVRFGINSVAKFSGLDPPMEMERLSPNTSQQLFPRESEDDSSFDEYDDETKQNCHILAQWDSFDDELDQFESDDDESIEEDNSQEDEKEHHHAALIVEEEEDFFEKNVLISPNISHRSKILPRRPKKRVDEYMCKVCGNGVRRTSRYVYEEE